MIIYFDLNTVSNTTSPRMSLKSSNREASYKMKTSETPDAHLEVLTPDGSIHESDCILLFFTTYILLKIYEIIQYKRKSFTIEPKLTCHETKK